MANYQYEILYVLTSGSHMQTAVITATDPSSARRIFEQQNPKCKILGTPSEVRPPANARRRP